LILRTNAPLRTRWFGVDVPAACGITMSLSSLRTRAALAILPALWALTACGGVSASTNDPFVAELEGRNEIRVLVINSNFYDARVYVIGAGARRQLGTVIGKTDRAFTTAWTHSQDLRIQVRLLAGTTCTTESLPVDPGDTLQLQIMPDFESSAFCE
jgi:hypothetical protein